MTTYPTNRNQDWTATQATAQHRRHRLLDIGVRGCGIPIQERGCCEDDTREAETALRRLLVDERLLDRMQPFDAAEPFERCHLGAVQRTDGSDA